MQPTVTKVLGAVALGLLVFVIVVERNWKTTLEEEATSQVLVPVDAAGIRQIRITRQTGESKLEKVEDGSWRLASGAIRDQVDPESIKRLLDILSHLNIRETIRRGEIKSGDSVLDEMGFSASEQIDLKLDYPGKRAPQRFLIGTAGPLSDTVYIQVPGLRARRHLYIVDGDLRHYLAAPAETLRDKKVTRLHPSRILSYTLRTAFGEVELKRDAKDPRWFLTRPIQARANDDIAYSLLEEIHELDIEAFQDDKTFPPLTSTGGLDARTALFELRTDQGKVYKLQLKENPSPNPEQTLMLAKITGREAILQIRNNLVSRLPNNVNQLRYPFLADIDPTTVARIIIKSPENPDVDLRTKATIGNFGGEDRKQTKDWRVVTGKSNVELPANSSRINRLVEALNKERILEYRADTTSRLETYGLARPVATVSVTTAGMDAEEFDAFQKALADAKEAGKPLDSIKPPKAHVETRVLRLGMNDQLLLNANYENDPFIYGIDPSFLYSHLPTHPLDWRSLRLSGFDSLNVRKLEVIPAGGPELRLYHSYEEATWTGTLGGERIDAKIDPMRADRLASRLGSLEARQWLTQRAEAYQALATPSFEVRMEVASTNWVTNSANPEPVKMAIRFAPAVIAGDRVTIYYGQFVGFPDVFDMPAEIVEQLLEPVLKTP